MARVRERLIEEGLYSDGYFENGGASVVHFNHDELIVEHDPKYTPIIQRLMLDVMRYAVPLTVPVDADLKTKPSWG